ncbi:Type IV pilus biogenesis and competence protein pilQ precursor [Helicobacter mustelae]|uniref:pilus (MSHA type) biogenesis protein MshL n=3 Tax=Helicobacter mustelae TaxID=217 RepID=UPI000E05D51D|nr:pilus (MSHA type) biogenesis protein MshL [Helicobacter mustelae]STP13327.1 Type IV pilus biogenesis and competence protein pilQ precursor [Helicobacter mustelae]
MDAKRILKTFLLFCMFAFGKNLCEEKKFNLSISHKSSFKEVLETLAKECMLSLIYQDDAVNSILEQKNLLLNFHQASLSKILKTGFEALDLSYVFEDDSIKIKSLETKTFFLHYIATSRVAESSTNVIFSQDNREQYPIPTGMQMMNEYLTPSQNLLQLNQQQGNFTNRSGSKIASLDVLDFWGALETELHQIIFTEADKHFPSEGYQPITINKSSGFITITATPSQIKRATRYIQALSEGIGTQVLIDVQILTVSHKNVNTTGVDWGQFYQLGIQKSNAPLVNISGSGMSYGFNIFPQDLSIGKIVEFLEEYGSVQSISNPKILTLNNQPALISVGNIIRYTQSSIFQTSNTSTTLQNTRQQYPSIFAGILLDITPSIKEDNIILKINPSITSTKNKKIENKVEALPSPPNLSTNQISSIVRLKNNQRVILGGLISKTYSKEDRKIPLLGHIPLLKYLFSYSQDVNHVQEMVIIITPRIIPLP